MRPCVIAALSIVVSGCGAPQLLVQVDGSEVLSGDLVDVPTTRRFGDALHAELTVTNVGDAASTLDLDLPPGLATSDDLPAVLEPGQTAVVGLGLDADFGMARAVDEEAVLHSDDPADPAFALRVQGTLTPYIQVVDGSDQGALREAILREVRDQALVGAAVAIVEGQDIVYLEGFGYADLEAELAVDARVHRFRWASLSKGLTALAALTLVEDGALDLDAPVSDHVADYEVPTLVLPDGCSDVDCAVPIAESDRYISLRRLLSHTAGIQHYSNGAVSPVPPTSFINDPDINTGMAWALPLWTGAPLVQVPGQAYSYSTFGYNLAGVAVEGASGVSLGALVDQEIAPIIEATTLGPDEHWDPAPDRVVGYRWRDGMPERNGDDDVSWKLAGGGFESTVEDLARYCAGLLGDEIIDPDLRDDALWTAQTNAGSYALGFGTGVVDGERVAAHTGAQQSTRTAIWIDRDAERCFVSMTNSTWGDPAAMNRALRDEWDQGSGG